MRCTRFVLVPIVALALVHRLEAAEPPLRIPLSVGQCVQKAIENNLGVQSGEQEWEVARWNLKGEQSVFAPDLVASAAREADKRKNTVEQSLSQLSPFFDEENNVYNTALEGILPSGAKYRAGYSLRDLSNNLTNINVSTPYTSQFVSFMGVDVTQPLLKNAGSGTTMTRIRLAAAAADVGVEEFRKTLMATVFAVESAYWDLVLAQKELAMRTESVRIAEKILEDNRERVRAGKMSELEVLEAQAGVALRRTRLNEAHHRWIKANNDLLTLFSEPVSGRDAMIEASDAPAAREMAEDFPARMTRALKSHPEYLQRLKEVEQSDIRLHYAKNQLWPQVDLVASYGYNGLGDGAGSSWDDMIDDRFEAWSVGATLRVPWGNGRARSDVSMARLQRTQALLNLKATEVALANRIDAVLRKVQDLRQTIDDHRVVAEFNEKVLEVELQRLDAGKSDSRRVLEIEDDLSQARIAQVKGLVEFETAAAELSFSEGVLLADRGYEILDIDGDIESSYRSLRRVAQGPAVPPAPGGAIESPVLPLHRGRPAAPAAGPAAPVSAAVPRPPAAAVPRQAPAPEASAAVPPARPASPPVPR